MNEDKKHTHSNAENVGSVRRNGDQVHSNNSHRVVVNHETEVRVDSSIDNSHSVRRVLGDGNGKASTGLVIIIVITINVGAVDETIVQGWGTARLGSEVKSIDSLVTPVVQEDVAEILIVVGSGGTVDQDTTKDTLPGLKTKVRVVPGGTVLLGLPGVSDLRAGRSRALCDGRYTIILVGVVLPDTVEVNAGSVGGRRERVGHVDNDSVTWIEVSILRIDHHGYTTHPSRQ